ncbi:hypothetical protein K469DRAFT_573958 [Zopfia rhizophila CBS 207.26]|uniref:Uncharacterized protein n=1 Tax=Zopfia rhizophila CBS 207.26 TaxID=1314779 RepID=A0A6A6E246_9PEZI|nr:hypothetical protein K469DRAFT_573958 [Zopfia rhizophila CBS 207.26]
MATQDQKCGFEGNADMYGMGIRIGYYLQWYGTILAAWIAPEESQGLRIANSLFVTATFFAFVILTIRGHSPEEMPIVETYIILFLTFGSYLVLVPIYVWRIFTGCNPLWDPTRFPRVTPGRVYKVCNTIILVTVLIFQLWFWIHQVPKLNAEECKQYGFFFWKFALNSKPFMARIYTLQILDSASQCIVTTVIIIGVEFTIVWNKIEGVHEISSAGQTIPLFIGVGSVAMVFYVRFFKKPAEQVLTDGAPNNPGMVQSGPTQGWEMGNVNTVYNPTTAPAHAAPVQATAWDDLPGAARGGEGSNTHVLWGRVHGYQGY